MPYVRVAAPTAAQIADAKTTLEMYFYEASENGEAPGFSVPAEDCSAKAQAFLAVSGPGKECDPVKADWCSHAMCKTSASSFYEACKAGPAYGPVPGVTAVKSAMALMGCDPTATEGA